MKSKGQKNLTRVQRLMLEDCLKAKMHKKDIAKKLGCCLTTIYNEIKRGEYLHTYKKSDYYGIENTYKQKKQYSADIAQEKYEFNKTAHGGPLKVGNDFEFVRYVEKRIIEDKLSPGAIAGEIKRNNLFKTVVSKTTMYRYIRLGIFINVKMANLPIGLKRKRYEKTVAKRLSKGTSIEKRPEYVSNREEFGHWEMDCIIGSTRECLLTFTERLTRFEIVFKIPNKKAESVVQKLNVLERKFGKSFRQIFKSITVDNGGEFSDYKGLEKSSYKGQRTKLYYCHPYCSCERGSNERLNREFRRWLPKGTSFSKLTDEKLQSICQWINDYPREIFGYATSQEMFNQQLLVI